MPKKPTQPSVDIEEVIHRYGDMLFRLCYVILSNKPDTEDAVQEVLMKWLHKAPPFESAEHEKAWLITVATNVCRDMHRFRLRHTHLAIEDFTSYLSSSQTGEATYNREILEALMTLPDKFKAVLVLYYVEDYRVKEIASMIQKTPSAVKMRLQKGRKLLAIAYRKGRG